MTSTPVTDVGLMVPYMNETGGNVKPEGADFMGSLKSAIESQSTGMNMKQDVVGMTDKASKVDSKDLTQDVKKTSDVSQKSDDSVKNTKTKTKDGNDKAVKSDDKVSEDTAEAVTEKAGEIVKEVADKMDVSEEDVVNAMELLGLTMADLFDPAKMTDLVATLSGNEDALSILTDESLYQTLGNLQEFVANTTEDLMKELDLSQEALDKVLTQTEELLEQTVVDDEKQNVIDSPLTGMKDFKVTVQSAEGEQTMSVRTDEATGAQVATVESTVKKETADEEPSNKNSDDKENSFDHQASLFTQELQMNNIDVPEAAMPEGIETYGTQAQEIAEQIMESMKVNMSSEVTELEMSLHPASLGNVKVNLTAEGGQVTAQFIAQNETVRSAIESQVVQLTKQLEEQGIKVEAVEVTLASHQFESGSEQTGAGEQHENASKNQSKVGRIRRLDLGELEDEEALEELDESDRIAADMMAKSGNTVDYTA